MMTDRSRRILVAVLIVSAVALAVWARVVALDADPDFRLCWSSGLLTDEGFYTHNARNAILLGHARTNEFNNMVLSPLVHAVQAAVFRLFGVGYPQARAISVVCSLLTLIVMFAALRRAFGERVAWLGTLVLAWEHAYLMYNRMALLETPATLFLALAFYAWVRRGEGLAWSALAGVMTITACSIKSLCAFFIPAPLLASWWSGRTHKRDTRWEIAATAGGMLIAGLLYAIVWLLPHWREYRHMSDFYLTYQIMPRNLFEAYADVRRAVLNYQYGLMGYLFAHMPVTIFLALTTTLLAIFRREERRSGNGAVEFLLVWMWLGVALLAFIRYAPSRYYVPIYPAIVALAVIGVVRLPEITRMVWRPREWWAHLLRTLMLGYALYFGLAFALGAPFAWSLVYLTLAIAFPLALVLQWIVHRLLATGGFSLRWAPAAALVVLAGWNAWYFAGWYGNRQYSLKNLAQKLERILPQHAVVAGNCAPGVCLDAPVSAMLVIPRLANYPAPIERYGVTHVVMLDGIQGEYWWQRDYPELLRRRNRVMREWVGPYAISVYRVPGWLREAYRWRLNSHRLPVHDSARLIRGGKGGS
ncbi:MAG: glycosyltransferase family 39 protein [Chthonomonadetes bacterium]|nr:glycosyltransferase family 39 protein [Chthonomonadetes bacterium]